MKPYNRDKSTKSEEVREMFDNIAPAYDKLNHILSMQIDKIWRRNVVKLVSKFESRKIVDLATGTGDLAIAIAKAIPQAKIVGIDLSQGMLDEAKRKIEAQSLGDRISLICASAEELPLNDDQYDTITVAFGVRNFGDIEAGLSEIHRALRPGGHLVVLEFSTPRNWLIAPLYRLYSHKILPFIGGLISKDRRAYDYLPASVDEFASPEEFSKLLYKVGFTACRARSQSFGIAQIYVSEKPLKSRI